MLAKLSSKGQLVIPKSVRQTLGLQAGTRFRIHVTEGRILLEPIAPSIIDTLHGKYSDTDLLSELEEEHQREIEGEEAVCS